MTRDILSTVLFSMVYKSGRRKHSHRCRACWKIVEDGQPIIMLRQQRGTWILHDACKNTEWNLGETWETAFKLWAIDRLKSLGYSEKSINETLNPSQKEKSHDTTIS